MKRIVLIALFFFILKVTDAQTLHTFADSIKSKFNIPELAFAVVTADTVLDFQVAGVQRMNTNYYAHDTDRFHIGSNTKAITAFIAATLVEENKIKWNTKFFELFPQLKAASNKAYYNITLSDLLTFRATLPAYTYTFDQPTKKQITGNEAHQRLLLAKYFLSRPAMKPVNGLTPSNADYILAGLMLEEAANKPYKELVKEAGKRLDINFEFDYPNYNDTLQTWGHDVDLKPLPPSYNYKLNWLLSAGNINIDLPDYTKFIQLILKGLNGKDAIISKKTYNKLLFGLPVFSFGWFNNFDSSIKKHIAYNEGNAGAFITQVHIVRETNKAFIIFTNAATEQTEKGVSLLMTELKKKYNY